MSNESFDLTPERVAIGEMHGYIVKTVTVKECAVMRIQIQPFFGILRGKITTGDCLNATGESDDE